MKHTSFDLANNAVPQGRRDIPNVPTAAQRYASARTKVSENRGMPATKPVPEPDLVRLGLLPCEGFDVEVVARRHADQLVRDNHGLRCLPGEVVAEMIAERDARAEAERRRWATELAQAQADGNLARERRLRHAAAQRQLVGDDGAPPDPRQALAMLKEADGSRDRELNAAAASRLEFISGQGVYHSYRDSQEDQ